MKLVASNAEDTIRKTTARAFGITSKISDKRPESISSKIMEAITVLTELKGIGPASASLLLSVRNPDSVPFFSDEAYRWLTYTTGNPWSAGIKYNAREFRAMLSASLELCQRLSVDAVDVERVGWVLRQEDSNLKHIVSEAITGSKRKQGESEVEDVVRAASADGSAERPADGPDVPQPSGNTRHSKRVKR